MKIYFLISIPEYLIKFEKIKKMKQKLSFFLLLLAFGLANAQVEEKKIG
ncbi:MAG: hypothetical protein AB7E26_07095 [Chryseobacterium sp.]